MATDRLGLFKKRRLRVRNKLRKINKDKVRLSVHRSSKNIYVLQQYTLLQKNILNVTFLIFIL